MSGRLLLLTLIALLMSSSSAFASGFGWYVCSVEWDGFKKTVQGLREEADELLTGANTPRLREYLQLQADSAIVQECEGTSEGPISAEFYSVDLARYALSVQERAGIKHSFFEFFLNPPDVIAIKKRDTRPWIDPVYFALSPDQIRAFHAEVVALNELKHSKQYRSLLRHLEAVLLKTTNENWDWSDPSDSNGDVVAEYGNGEHGLIFYGHD